MQTVFLSRRQYDRLCGLWLINGEAHNAYLSSKRCWTRAGVSIKTDNAALLALVEQVKAAKEPG